MIKNVLITGGFGFIGSNLCVYLNSQGIVPYILEDLDHVGEKWRNVRGLRFHLMEGIGDINRIEGPVSVVHLAARVDTREKMGWDLWHNNVTFTKDLLKQCQDYQILDRFIYASSGSVYGAEEEDFTERLVGLRPLNAYAMTKWILDNDFFGGETVREKTYALRFTNVFGPREQAKGDMASLVHKGLVRAHPLVTRRADGSTFWSLFKSDRPDIRDGEQARDFIHSDDVCRVIYHFLTNAVPSGIYNLGSGVARTFNDLAKAVDREANIQYVELPTSLRGQYQSFTQADLTKLREVAGYTAPFLTLEEGIAKTREWLKSS